MTIKKEENKHCPGMHLGIDMPGEAGYAADAEFPGSAEVFDEFSKVAMDF